MADMAPITGTTQRSSADILKSIDDQVKNLSGGDSEKVKEVYKNVVEILSGDNVKVSRGATTGVDGNRDTSKTNGSTGVPVLDEPNDAKAKEADLSKLISYLQLDNQERQAEMAKDRIDMQKSNLDTEHKDRMKQINEQIKKMEKAEKAAKISRIFGWIGAALAIAAAVALTIVTGGLAAGFAIAGAVLAVTSLVLNETGAMDKMTEKLADHLQEKYGWDRNKAMLAASLIINISIMVLQLGCSVGGMVAGIAAAGKAAADAGATGAKVAGEAAKISAATLQTARQVQTGITVANTGVGAVSLGMSALTTYRSFKADSAKADTTELEKFITMLRQRLDESQEELQKILEQIQSGIGKIAELCGFGSSEQLSRVFRRETGVSPRKFRNDSE